MYLGFPHRVAVDQNVIKVGREKVVEEGSEDIVDEVLDGNGGVGRSKRHNEGFKETVTDAECCFPLLTFSHTDQVVSVVDIPGGVIVGFGKAIQGLADQR
jgi:hypothetical protein